MSTAPPAWLSRICAGISESSITVLCSVLSLWRFAVSYLSLFRPLFFSSPQAGFCYRVCGCWYFSCDVTIPRMAICCLLWGLLKKNIVQQQLMCVVSIKATIYFLSFCFLKKRFVCLLFSDRTVTKSVSLFCKLFSKMSTRYLSHGFMSPWQPQRPVLTQ